MLRFRQGFEHDAVAPGFLGFINAFVRGGKHRFEIRVAAGFERGQADAFAADQVVLIGQVIARGGRKLYALSNELFSFEPFALAVPRGDADFQLVADRVLSRLNRSGEIVGIYKKWFGSFGEKPPSALDALYQLNSTPP